VAVQTTVHLPEDLYERLRRAAFDRRISQSAIITMALEEWFKEAGDLGMPPS